MFWRICSLVVGFRGLSAAAELKPAKISPTTRAFKSMFPRPECRGRIEAANAQRCAVLHRTFPRPECRGRIEAARRGSPEMPDLSFRGLSAAAELKPLHRGGPLPR